MSAIVVNDSNKLTDIWAQLDYYAIHGHMRDEGEINEVKIDDLEISDIITRLLTIPSFISKTNKKIALMPDGDDKTALKKLVLFKKKELQAIKNLRFKK